MATQLNPQEPQFDDTVSELMALGWTPPASVGERYRHLLKPYYAAHGWDNLPLAKLDAGDLKAIAGLMAVFNAFGIPIPPAPEPNPKPGSIVVLD